MINSTGIRSKCVYCTLVIYTRYTGPGLNIHTWVYHVRHRALCVVQYKFKQYPRNTLIYCNRKYVYISILFCIQYDTWYVENMNVYACIDVHTSHASLALWLEVFVGRWCCFTAARLFVRSVFLINSWIGHLSSTGRRMIGRMANRIIWWFVDDWTNNRIR